MDSPDPLNSDQQQQPSSPAPQQGQQPPQQQQQRQVDSGRGPGTPTTSRFPRPLMPSIPDTRQQSFDEIYGPPENFLEIEVCLWASRQDESLHVR